MREPSMKPAESFGVGVRLVGLFFAIYALPGCFQLDIYSAAHVVAGLILVTRADSIVRLCYPKNARQEWLDSQDL